MMGKKLLSLIIVLIAVSIIIYSCGSSDSNKIDTSEVALHEQAFKDDSTKSWKSVKSDINSKWRKDAEECDNGYFTIVEGKPYCRPYQLQGANETKNLNATAAQITFADRWTRKHCPLITTDPTYHMNYLPEGTMRFPPVMKGDFPKITERLNNVIRELHKKVGNAETEGYNIVIGNGATHVIASIMWAYSDTTREVCVKSPAWSKFDKIYKHIPNMKWNTACYTKEGRTNENKNILQFVTIPNNPDGNLDDTPMYKGEPTVYDMVYYWPSCVFGKKKIKKRNYDIMVFSLSKLLGYASTRFGWALVKDEKIAKRMEEYINNTQLNISVDAQLRTIHMLETLTQKIGTKDDFFPFASNELQNRWKRLENVFKNKPNWEIKNVEHLGYILWLRTKNGNAYELLKKVKIDAEKGEEFYNVGKKISDHYVRVDIGQEPVVFNKLIERLDTL
jgi:aspartate/methionine/tyrosine aminotransferase